MLEEFLLCPLLAPYASGAYCDAARLPEEVELAAVDSELCSDVALELSSWWFCGKSDCTGDAVEA